MRFSLFRGTIVLGFAVTTLAQAPRGIQDVLSSWQKSPYANYPTQFTRDIIPVSLTPPFSCTLRLTSKRSLKQKKIHSHNDYWRKTPLYTGTSKYFVVPHTLNTQTLHSHFEWRDFRRSGCMALQWHLICRINTPPPNFRSSRRLKYNRWATTHLL